MTNIAHLSTSTNPLPQSWIEKMFDKMLLDYGKKFIDQWAGANPDKLIAHWANEMASYTGPEIKRGLAAMEGRDWPPTLPEFKKLCRPPIDPMVAYYEAVAGVQARSNGEVGTWSHPAIYWAAMPLSFDLGTQTYAQIKGRWEKSLAEQMEKGEWAAIPVPMVALPAPGKAELSKEKAAQMIEEIGAAEVLKPKNDHLRWAKNAMEDLKRGGKRYPAITYRFAKEALGAK